MAGWTVIMILWPCVPYSTMPYSSTRTLLVSTSGGPKKESSHHHHHHHRRHNHHTAPVPVPAPIKIGSSWSPLRDCRILPQSFLLLPPQLPKLFPLPLSSFQHGSRAKHIPAEERTESEKTYNSKAGNFYFIFVLASYE
ncbi:hypothetical protein HOY82DRAFT_570996 [Tuber indicum]|nr:hypothetical protein HOY82DRAFT_570996 [Tuber indicum]